MRCDTRCSLYNAKIALLYPPTVDTTLYLLLSSLVTLSATSISLAITINVNITTIPYVSKKLKVLVNQRDFPSVHKATNFIALIPSYPM